MHRACLLALVCSTLLSGLSQAQGPRYRADVQLIDKGPPVDVLPPGPAIYTCRGVIIDTGSPVTFFNKECALGFGLLLAGPPQGPNPALLDPVTPRRRFGGAGGGGFVANCSKPLGINAGGLGRDLVRFKVVQGVKVYFPLPAGVNLLGTDFIANLAAGQALTCRRDGSASFYDPKETVGRRTDFRRVPGPFEGTERLLVSGVRVAGPSGPAIADFAVVSGSPYTVLSSALAGLLGIPTTPETIGDQEFLGVLRTDGYLGPTTVMLGRGTLNLLELPFAGPLPPLRHTNRTVFVNPDSTENLLGTSEFFFDAIPEINAVEFDTRRNQLVFAWLPCEVAGAGHAGGGVPVQCVTPPRVGTTFCVGFGNPSPGLLLVGFGACLQPPIVLDPPAVCSQGFLYVLPLVLIPFPAGGQFCAPLPPEPLLVGLDLCLQAAFVAPQGCAQLSDALAVTIGP